MQHAKYNILTRMDIGAFMNELQLAGDGVEIGVYRGEYAESLLETWNGRRLYLVDSWRHLPEYVDVLNVSDDEHENNLRITHQRVRRFGDRVQIIRATSPSAAFGFADHGLDFVYIDANHRYEAVFADLNAWWPKLRVGGLFSGHDYLDGTWAAGEFGVKRAVDEFAMKVSVTVLKTQEPQSPSWYFLKPPC